MKKLASILISAALLTSLCGCAGSGNDSDKLSVVATIYPAYDFACQVFGDTAEVTLLLKPGTESHTYDPSAKDIVKINECDLFIYNGGESDQWVDSILEGADDINTLRMMDVVELHEEVITEGMQHDDDCTDEAHDHDEHSDEYDEHIWTSPANAAEIVAAVGEAAKALLPEKADDIALATEDYIAQINSLDLRFAELLGAEERCFVFGDRFPLLYFFEQYDLSYTAAFPGCGSNVEPSAQTMTYLLDKLSGEDVVPAVFCIELSSRQIADTLADDCGLPVVEFHTCHNITADDFKAGENYVSLMERNYAALSEILGGE